MTAITIEHNSSENQVWLISANDLMLGDIVYYTASGSWSRQLSEAACLTLESEARAIVEEHEARHSQVLSPTLVKAYQVGNSKPVLSHYRDRYREVGPTHRTDLLRVSHSQ